MYLARESVAQTFKLLLFINTAFYMIRCFSLPQGETVNLFENKVSSERKVS